MKHHTQSPSVDTLLQQASAQFAQNSGRVWTPQEDERLLKSTDLFATAIDIGRSFETVRTRYRKLRKKGYFI